RDISKGEIKMSLPQPALKARLDVSRIPELAFACPISYNTLVRWRYNVSFDTFCRTIHCIGFQPGAMQNPTPPAPLLPDLQIYTLGDVQIELGARPVPKLTKPTKALLVYLALNAARPHPREQLAQMLWLSVADEGDPQEEKRAND